MITSAVGDLDYKYEVLGIKRGQLWPYLESPKVYHCPGDSRMRQTEESSAYRSYSVLWTMNGS